jgi:hypothetical protein
MPSFNVGEAVGHSQEKRVREPPFKKESLKVEMLSYLSGQAISLHHYPMLFVLADSKHAISRPGPSNLVALYVKANRLAS